ncbi:MAG: methylated-DNA--[protein]-cysteine S-methyltransferase [Longimicrobiales bacterium]
MSCAAGVSVLWVDEVRPPLGTLTMVAADDALCALAYPAARSRMLARIRSRFPGVVLKRRRDPKGYATRVRAYFSRDLGALDGIAVDCGGTSFEEQVWKAVRATPAETTTTYLEIAEVVGHPRAVRAVGGANACNPACLVIPCHRMIGSDGHLKGYAGGISRKRWLLEHECARSPSARTRRRARDE